ncbi:MAG: menaquinone biosynthesis decarboxylase [Bacteroidales bacterium]|jgi:4-hydroxy-3-polyprenylbenzoate decarboxylase|nr:menaquinone biosynthesis decarboxylase [Bacteroidales bacterium]MDD4058358.1 menaquinone biosynthesis decarboxylase [Bacteroidales bacterium]
MYKSLKEFVEFLESKNELVRIKEFVDPVLEIAEITDRVSKEIDGGKALLFENTGSTYPVLTNMMGSEKRILYALGAESFDEISNSMKDLIKQISQQRGSLQEKLKALPILGRAASWMPKPHRGIAACQEVILHKPDLNRLPILKCWPEDGGKFITLPLVHTKDPITGIRNVGMYRMQVFNENSTGMHWHRHKTGARQFSKCKESKFPVAVALGGDPVYTYAATAPLPEGIDEYMLAGFLRNKAVSLVDCLTQPLQVPADCDFIIEGYIDTKESPVMEGPFGDHTGFYSLADLYPRMHITCISHKKEAIYPATIVGIPPQEDKYIAIATEKIFLTPIQFTMVPEIKELHLPEEGVGHNIAIAKIEKNYPGQGIKVAHALWGAGQMMFCKTLIVTDEDIDIRDKKEIERVILKNYLPERDTHFSRGPADVLDHTSPSCGYGGKMLIDATKKLPEEGGAHKTTSKIAFHITHSADDTKGLINILLDSWEETGDNYHAMWLWGSNWDPVRDTAFVNGHLLADSRRKYTGKDGFNREWPEKAHSSQETIDKIDLKWDRLGLGSLISSPSLRFLPRQKEQVQ